MKKTKPLTIVMVSLLPILMAMPLFFLGKPKFKYLVGELAYCLFICDVIIGLRPRWLEKRIELKTLYLVHGFMAIFAVGLAIIHELLSHLHGLAGTMGNIAFYGSIGFAVLELIFLSNQFLYDIPIVNQVLKVIRWLSNRLYISRELNLFLHLFTPFIVIFVFLHVLLIPKFSHNSNFMFFFVSYFGIFIFLYLYYGIYTKLHVSHYVVTSINQENNHSFELTLTYKFGKHLKIKGGQFIFIATPFSFISEYHPFSVLAVKDNGKQIKLGIKEEGDFTKKMAQLQKGTMIRIKGVYGHMTAPSNKQPVICIAGGIGITPCISLLSSLPTQRQGILLWSVHAKNDLIFQNELTKLVQTHPNVKVICHISSEEGHLNENKLNNDLNSLKSKNNANYFICGPQRMSNSITTDLEKIGISSRHILSEGFIF